jgi:predicted DNA-binding WGR domain protein
VKVRWGRDEEARRLQTLTFDSVDDARRAFLARASELESRGFLDATAG